MFRSFRTCLPAFALAVSVISSTDARAGGTRSFYVDDFSALDSGEVEGAAIESSGRVTVGFITARKETTGTTAFSCLARGSEALVGTSDPANIVRVTLGKGGAPEVSPLATLEGVVVSAMATLPGGDVVAATLPGGTLWRVDSRGKVSEFAKLDVKQIWHLVVHRGRLLAATGPEGEVFSIGLDGKGPKVVLDVDDKDVLSLAVVGDNVIAGTSPGAKLYQVAKDLDGVLLHDFAGDEVKGLAVTNDGLLAVVNAFEDRDLNSLDALTKQLDRTSLVGRTPSGSSSGGKSPKADATVWHVDLGSKLDVTRAAEAAWEKWLTKEKQYFTGITAADGAVLVASSDSGKIYRIRSLRDVSTVADLEERQATSLCRLDRGVVIATSGGGPAVHRLAIAPAREASYRSKVFEAEQPASWGAVHVRGVGPLVLRARSGPSDKPDRRWSEWKTISLQAGPDGLRGSLATLPKRRYMQVEVQLAGPAATLRNFRIFYSPENLPPLVQSIDVTPPDFEDADDSEPDAEVTIKWKADARDDDELVYEVRVRPEGGTDRDWIKVHPEDKLVTKRELKWDISTVPDGVYEIGITASDAPTNGTARARTDQLVSAPVVVDRGRPTIRDAKASGRTVRGTASDDTSYIRDVTFSIDGGAFQAASPVDGLFDDRSEVFELALPESLTAGRHRLVIRARDAFGNFTTQALIIER